MHYTVIYTKSLDNAADMVAKSYEFTSKDDAIKMFNERLHNLLDKVLENEFLKTKVSLYRHKAIFKIEGTHYCLAIMSDEDMLKSEE